MQHKTSCEIHYTVPCFFCEMGFYISGRYWPFVIVFGYTLRDLAVNLLSNDASSGLDRTSSVAQRIVLYLAMFVIAVSCSTVIESLRKNRPSQGEVVPTDCNIVDVQNPVTQQINLGQSTLGEVQVQALSESGDLHLPKVPSRSADIPEPQALGGPEDLPHIELPSLPQDIPELEDFPLVGDLPPGGYVPHMEVSTQSVDIPKLQTLSQTEDVPLVKELPTSEDQPLPNGYISEVEKEVYIHKVERSFLAYLLDQHTKSTMIDVESR